METVLITGCSSGIGRATALAFLEEDWRVYATSRDPADIVDLDEAGCETAALDVTDDGEIEEVVERIADEARGIDCLVNNAGYAQFGPAEDLDVGDLHHQFDVNVYGPHRLVRAVLPGMRERDEGTIVNISSAAARLALPGMGAYAGSKSALGAMSDALRAEVAAFGVDVVLVEPGPVDTGFRERAGEELAPERDRTGAYDTLYRLFDDYRAIGAGGAFSMEPEAVADAIVNAASCTDPAARYPVGAVAKAAGVVRLLPDRVRDAAYRVATTFVR